MRTTQKVTLLMVLGVVVAVGACLGTLAWRTHELLVAQIQDKAFLVVHTFEAQMGPGFAQEQAGVNSIYQNGIREIQEGSPQVVEINLYRVSAAPSVVASSDPSQVGKSADPEDVEAAQTDAPVVLFGQEEGRGFVDVTAPLHHQGTIGYVMGIKLDIQSDLDALAGALVQSLVLALGLLVVLLASLVLVMRSMKRTLGAEPEDLVAVVERIGRGQFAVEPRPRATGVLLSLESLANGLAAKASEIDALAQRDFRGDITAVSEEDGLARSLQTMVREIDHTLVEVRAAMDEVAGSAFQVRQASQALSQNSTDQASGLAETSATAQLVDGRTRENAETAHNAQRLSRESLGLAQEGTRSMEALEGAMKAMEAASDNIQTVVKTIDDIAFQTNLLALNANVEAARAGKAGRGFAVVAEEVRNLARRSSDAVKETTVLVQASVTRTREGAALVAQTSGRLSEIALGAQRVADLIGQMADASRSQADDLGQVTEALGQIDQMTQRNTATSEETAAAAEVLDAQVKRVQSLVSRFQLRG